MDCRLNRERLAATVAECHRLSMEAFDELLANADINARLLEQRGESPGLAFDTIGRLAMLFAQNGGEGFRPRTPIPIPLGVTQGLLRICSTFPCDPPSLQERSRQDVDVTHQNQDQDAGARAAL